MPGFCCRSLRWHCNLPRSICCPRPANWIGAVISISVPVSNKQRANNPPPPNRLRKQNSRSYSETTFSSVPGSPGSSARSCSEPLLADSVSVRWVTVSGVRKEWGWRSSLIRSWPLPRRFLPVPSICWSAGFSPAWGSAACGPMGLRWSPKPGPAFHEPRRRGLSVRPRIWEST